jgi:transposase, IS5 family
MTKLPSTSATSIAIIFLAMNLSSLLKEAICLFLCLFFAKKLFLGFLITKNYDLDVCI